MKEESLPDEEVVMGRVRVVESVDQSHKELPVQWDSCEEADILQTQVQEEGRVQHSPGEGREDGTRTGQVQPCC